MSDTRDTTPAGKTFPDFLKRDPITPRSAADMPRYQGAERQIKSDTAEDNHMKLHSN